MKDISIKELQTGTWKFANTQQVFSGILKNALIKDISRKNKINNSTIYYDQYNKIVMFQIKK